MVFRKLLAGATALAIAVTSLPAVVTAADNVNAGSQSGTEIPVKQSKVLWGDPEGRGNLRIELYNEFGDTYYDPPIDPDDIVNAKSVWVTFTIDGLYALGNMEYTASMMFADDTWNAYDYDSAINIVGDGTYRIGTNLMTWGDDVPVANGVKILCIDIQGLAWDLDIQEGYDKSKIDISDVKVEINASYDKVGLIKATEFDVTKYLTYEELKDGSIAITGYTGNQKNIVIPDKIDGKKVTQIADNAFYTYSWIETGKLASIELPNTVTSIGSSAFNGQNLLTDVKLSSALTSIGSSAFANCTSLASVTIPSKVTSIGSSAFAGCTSLAKIELPSSLTEIGISAFTNCTSLKNIKIPASVTEIAYGTFYGCSSLAQVEIPSKVTSINGNAFRECTSLDGVKLPDSLTLIGSGAFQNCASLTKIEIPAAVASIEDKAFLHCDSLTAINVNKNNKNYASADGVLFNKDNTLLICYPIGKTSKTYSIPGTVTSIGSYAFEYCTTLTGVTIPDGVTLIGQLAFDNCTSLKKIVIPGSVTSIGSNAFAYCSALTEAELVKGVGSIGNYAFFRCSALEKLELNDGLTSIGMWAFGYCKSLAKLTLPDTLTSIGYYAFSECEALKEIKIPSSLTDMSEGIFAGCTSLEKAVIADGVTEISKAAFSGCTALKEVELPDSLTVIGWSVFRNCTALENISIPEGLTFVGASAFSGCKALTGIDLPDSVSTIGGYAFAYTPIEEMDLPASVTEIAYGTFYGCSELTDVDIPEGVASIGYDAFNSCTSLEEIVLPDTTITIGERAFAYCTALTAITIPVGVASIPDSALAISIEWESEFDDEGYFVGSYQKYTYSDDLVIYGYTGSYAEEYAKEHGITFKSIGFVREDKKSGIQVGAENGVVPKDTELTVTLLPSEDDYPNAVFDIGLVGADGKPVQPKGEVTVVIPVPQELSGGAKYYVYYKDKDGELTDMNAAYADGYVAFTTTHFSTYILTYQRLIDAVVGDINSDGDVNDLDVVQLARHLAGWNVNIDKTAADVNGDGEVNDLDVVTLARRLAGWNV